MTLTRFALVAAAALICAPVFSQIKPCEELKSEIDAKLKDRGAVAYTLEIVPAEMETQDMRIVGICNGGKNKIAYVIGIAAPKVEIKATAEVPKTRDKFSEAPVITVLNPMGTPPPITPKPMASRMETLEGKTIYFVNTGYIGTDRLMAEMLTWFKENYPNSKMEISVKKLGLITK
jgi:hypothetical protein